MIIYVPTRSGVDARVACMVDIETMRYNLYDIYQAYGKDIMQWRNSSICKYICLANDTNINRSFIRGDIDGEGFFNEPLFVAAMLDLDIDLADYVKDITIYNQKEIFDLFHIYYVRPPILYSMFYKNMILNPRFKDASTLYYYDAVDVMDKTYREFLTGIYKGTEKETPYKKDCEKYTPRVVLIKYHPGIIKAYANGSSIFALISREDNDRSFLTTTMKTTEDFIDEHTDAFYLAYNIIVFKDDLIEEESITRASIERDASCIDHIQDRFKISLREHMERHQLRLVHVCLHAKTFLYQHVDKLNIILYQFIDINKSSLKSYHMIQQEETHDINELTERYNIHKDESLYYDMLMIAAFYKKINK
jgi:hypothetical protein